MDQELRQEDVEAVLDGHGVALASASRERVIDDALLEAERIEELMLEHSGFDARQAALLSAIEDVLIEQGIIQTEKLFFPEDADSEDEGDMEAEEESEVGESYLS